MLLPVIQIQGETFVQFNYFKVIISHSQTFIFYVEAIGVEEFHDTRSTLKNFTAFHDENGEKKLSKCVPS